MTRTSILPALWCALVLSGCSAASPADTQAQLNALARAVPFERMGQFDLQVAQAVEAQTAAGKTLSLAALDSLRPPLLTDGERDALRAFHDFIATMDVTDIADADERERLGRIQTRLRTLRANGTYEAYLNLY